MEQIVNILKYVDTSASGNGKSRGVQWTNVENEVNEVKYQWSGAPSRWSEEEYSERGMQTQPSSWMEPRGGGGGGWGHGGGGGGDGVTYHLQKLVWLSQTLQFYFEGTLHWV